MDYEKKYKEALERAREIYNEDFKAKWLENLFPELKESEDENMRSKIIAAICLYYGTPLEEEAKEMIAWLEKQGENSSLVEEMRRYEPNDLIEESYQQQADDLIDMVTENPAWNKDVVYNELMQNHSSFDATSFDEGYEAGEKYILNHACEWLQAELAVYHKYHNTSDIDMDSLIRDFRRDMENIIKEL